MVDKIRTDISFLSGVKGVSVTQEKSIPRKKRNMKSPATLPPRKDQIPNQDTNMLGTKKYQSLPPQWPKLRSGYISLRNEVEDDRNDSTDTSLNDK